MKAVVASRTFGWLLFAAFAVIAFVSGWHPGIFDFTLPLGALKLSVWILWAAFLAYSVRCSLHENIFRTIKSIARFHWGRQIGIDLYLGLLVALLLIYLNQGLWAVALWLVPILLFANLATLLYVAIHFDSIVSAFLL